MMSAKTVLNEAPACPTPAAPNNAASATTPGGAPSDFQNVLAGAVPPAVEPALAITLPTQPLVQLLTLKNQQQAAKLANAAASAHATPGAQSGKPVVSPADLLQLLDQASLLPEAGDPAPIRTPVEELPDTELVTKDDDILTEWLEGMLPSGVFAPQAGSASNTDANASADSGESGNAGRKQGVAQAALPASLVVQAGLPERTESSAAGAAATQGAAAALTINRDGVAAAAQNAATAFAAVLPAKSESTERDTPADSWMSAMGDLTSKRGPEMAPVLESRLPTPVHDTRWADALAHRLVMMARDGESVASLKLVPVDLGPLDIQITVRDGEASVHFGAAHQETRAVLESSLPRLRELLSAQGLQLSNATVSHQSAGQNRHERSVSGGAVSAVAEETEITSKVISTSLLDTYA